jgi:hypothetical protein
MAYCSHDHSAFLQFQKEPQISDFYQLISDKKPITN